MLTENWQQIRYLSRRSTSLHEFGVYRTLSIHKEIIFYLFSDDLYRVTFLFVRENKKFMAATARRIGLSTRFGRKTSREDDSSNCKSRKISSGRQISREENINTFSVRKSSRGLQEGEIHCQAALEAAYSISRPEAHSSFDTKGTRIRRKISVYARPESLEREVNPQGTRWQEFLMRYEPIILSSLVLLIVSVSLYIVFVERQSLFSK